MTTQDDRQQPDAPVTDTEGKPVNVVERDIEQSDSDAEDFDQAITPTSIKRKEQDAETLERRNQDVERQLDN